MDAVILHGLISSLTLAHMFYIMRVAKSRIAPLILSEPAAVLLLAPAQFQENRTLDTNTLLPSLLPKIRVLLRSSASHSKTVAWLEHRTLITNNQ